MISTYVDNKELKRVIEDGKIKTFKVKEILKTQGIMLSTKNAEQIADQVYPILWGCKDIEAMSQSIDDGGNYIKTSILELKIDGTDTVLDDISDLFTGISYSQTRYSLANIMKFDDNKMELKMKYEVSRPGRNAFISITHKQTTIVVTKKSEDTALIDVRQASTSEMKEFNLLLTKLCKDDQNIHTRHFSFEHLTNENRGAFFDQFNKQTIPGWRFETVTKVELKRSEGTEEDIEALSEGEENSIANLEGISSAILNGTSIRNNSFVQECINNDFYIASMGYKFESTTEYRAVVVEINFKYDDLKIDICKTFEFDDDAGDLKVYPSLQSIQETILAQFQDVAYRQFLKILEKQKKDAILLQQQI